MTLEYYDQENYAQVNVTPKVAAFKTLLGDGFYEFKDSIIIEDLKEMVSYLLDPKNDPFSRKDEHYLDVSALFTVLKSYMLKSEYDAYIKSLGK